MARRCLTGVAGVLALALTPGSAEAAISFPTVLAGPSSSIVGVGNVAMTQDGTGGMVWRQVTDGQPHIFVSAYRSGHWGPPIQADAGEAGPATFPVIAAANHGELLVAWVQPYESVSTGGGTPTTVYELLSATLQPGSRVFEPPVTVDSVGNGTGVYPQIAMAPDGNAYAAYKVVTNALAPDQPQPITPQRPGDELIDVRVARFNGLTWSSLGAVNEFPGQVTMRAPTAFNAPSIGIGPTSQAMVIWQEPTIDGVARIWARRIFGNNLAPAQELSPATINGEAVSVDADSPELAFGTNSGAEAMFRLQGGSGSPLTQPAEMLTSIGTSSDATNGGSFTPAVSIAQGSSVGIPAISTGPLGSFQAAFTVGGDALLSSGSASDPNGPSDDMGTATGDPVSDIEPTGGGTVAWPGTSASGLPVVRVVEQYPGNVTQSGTLSAPIAGAISDLTVGQSGAGDALLGFQQGTGAATQVTVAAIQAPPRAFPLIGPFNWVTPQRANIVWGLARSSIGPVTYSIVVGGQTIVSGLTKRHYLIPAGELGSGSQTLEIVATDTDGQETATNPSKLKIDATPPAVSTKVIGGESLKVTVSDRYSGVRIGATRIDFGDGSREVRGTATATHQYPHRGRYVLTVHCVSQAGNAATDHISVMVR